MPERWILTYHYSFLFGNRHFVVLHTSVVVAAVAVVDAVVDVVVALFRSIDLTDSNFFADILAHYVTCHNQPAFAAVVADSGSEIYSIRFELLVKPRVRCFVLAVVVAAAGDLD